MRPPSEEDFKEWRDGPITKWVMGLMAQHAEQQKTLWAKQQWQSKDVDPELLHEARVREDCYRALPEMDYDEWMGIHDTTTD